MKKPMSLGAIAALCLMTTGCTPRHLVFTTYTRVGLNITAADGVPTNLGFGYKRFEGVIIPVDPTKADGTNPALPSVRATLGLTNRWLEGLTLEQTFSTGKAAENP